MQAREVDDGDDDDLEETEPHSLATIDWRDFAAGICAGVSNLLVGHPFDTIKVRLQTQDVAKSINPAMSASVTIFAGGLDGAIQTVRKEGVRALYKGMGSPLLTTPIINAVVFTSYEQGKRIIALTHDTPRHLTLNENAFAGAYAGLVNCLVACPVELIKGRLQVQYESNSRTSFYKGPLDCLRQIVAVKGVRGVFTGMTATILREVPAYVAQFYTYEWMKRKLTPTHKSVSDLPTYYAIACGGVSGLMCWTASYPQDIIKSRIQIQSDTHRKYTAVMFDGGFIDCWRQTVRNEGYMALWKGFGPCAARAVVANAAGFCTYETALKFLRKQNPQNANTVKPFVE